MVAGLAFLAGCQHFDRARECRALADGVNPELKELSTVYGKRTPTSGDQYRDASKKYRAAAVRLGKLTFNEPELARLSQELRDNLLGISRTCDRLAVTFDHPERPADVGAQQELDAHRQRHASLVSATDKFCQQP